MGLFISRVASKDNISDEPSREKYDLMKRLNAVRVEPRLSSEFREAQTWEALSIVRCLECER